MSRICSILFAWLFSLQVWAAGPSCRAAVDRLGGAAIEMEMNMSPGVLSLLTTTNGTVGGLFPDGKLPDFYVKWSKHIFPHENPRTVNWDELDDAMKHQLLIEASKRKKSDFFTDRKIPNMKVKDKIIVKFSSKKPFLGKWYKKGLHEIDVSGYFGNVEYKSPSSVKDVSGVELHLRSSEHEAGDVLESAWMLQDGLKIKRTHMHEHIVVPLPQKSLKANSVQTALAITEYYRRANLLAEFVAISDLNGIYPNKRFDFKYMASIRYFDSINPDYLSGIFGYLAVDKYRKMDLGSTYKMGWVGFRGSDLYDQPHLFGFEFRAINGDSDLITHRQIMTQIEKGLRTEDYGFDPKIMSEWSEIKSGSWFQMYKTSQKLKSIWYKKSYKQIFLDLPDYLKEVASDSVQKLSMVWSLKRNAKGNQAVKMLLYDWSKDPLFFGQPEAQAVLKSVQVKALQRHFENGESLSVVLRDFIWDSGLMQRVVETFHMKEADFKFMLEAG